jgi:ABC-2 type transport system ATP-binding protein
VEQTDGPGSGLTVLGIRKSFGARVVLEDLSLDVRRGEIVGLLGPNGAGKTTAFRVLAGLLPADAGSVQLDGVPIDPASPAFRRRLGVVFQDPSLDFKLTGRENLALGAALFGLSRRTARARVVEALALMELGARADEPVQKYSGGMRRRLEIARVLLHEPTMLLLDEPGRGVDPEALRRIWDEIERLTRARGLSVIVTTHQPEEAERCRRVVLLDRGRVVASGTPDGLRARVAGDVIRIEANRPDEVISVIEARRASLGLPPGSSPRLAEGKIWLEAPRGHELIPRLVELFPAGRLASLSTARPTLADVFAQLTGRGFTGDEERVMEIPAGGGAGAVPRRNRPPVPAAPLPDASSAPPAPRTAGAALPTTLGVVGALAGRDLRRFFRQPSRVVGSLAQPLILWAVLGAGLGDSFRADGAPGTHYLAYFYPGTVVLTMLFTAIFSTMSVIDDRHHGFLQAVLVAPVSRTALVLGKTAGGVTIALLQAAALIALSPLAGFPLSTIDYPLVFAALAATAVGFTALGFAMAWWIDSTQGYHGVMSVALIPLWMLSGAMFPASGSHGWIRVIMAANPMTYAVSAVRRGLDGAGSHGPDRLLVPWSSPSLELGVSVAFALLAVWTAAALCRRRA